MNQKRACPGLLRPEWEINSINFLKEPKIQGKQLPYKACITAFYGPVYFKTHFRSSFPAKMEAPLRLFERIRSIEN